MRLTTTRDQGRRRKPAIRAGLLAVSAAVAGGLGIQSHALADLSGFSSFAAPNIDASAVPTSAGSIGYSSNSTVFEMTDSRNSLDTSGFSSTPQNITSFSSSFLYQVVGGTGANSSSADGFTLTFENDSRGTAAVGGTGNGLGYSGITSSAADAFNIYNAQSLTTGTSAAATKGVNYLTGGTAATTYFGTPNVVLDSGNPIQVNIFYANGVMDETLTDTVTKQIYSRSMSMNIPTAVGSSTAYVGFTAGTGGVNSTQKISNFNFNVVAPMVYNPIPLNASSFNADMVLEKGAPQTAAANAPYITASVDQGTFNLANNVWYEKGYNAAATNTGLPASGQAFTSQNDTNHVFQMQSYTGNNVLLVGPTTGTVAAPASGTLTFSNAAAYKALSFLTNSGNGPQGMVLTINYADSVASTVIDSTSPDWFTPGAIAYDAGGRASPSTTGATTFNDGPNTINNTTPGTPALTQEDILLPDSTDPISSIGVTYLNNGGNTTGRVLIFGVSGVSASNAGVLLYTGAQNPGSFDTTSFNFNQSINSTTVAVQFTNGSIVTFDDSAVDTVHQITVAANTGGGGIAPGGLIFNNSTGTAPYNFSGAGIVGSGYVLITGGGTVILGNSNTYNGSTGITNGTLVLPTGGNVASSAVNIGTSGTLNLNGGTLSSSTLALNDSGAVNVANSTLSIYSLSGSGTLTSTNPGGTALTLTGSGTFGGTISLGAGNLTVNANGSTAVLTGSDTYSGGTYLKAGALEISSSSALGSGPLVLQGGAIGAYGTPVNLAGSITGGALILPSGSNVLELSGAANTFTGPVVIQSGATLQVDSAGAIGGINGANSATGTITVASGASFLDNDTNTAESFGLTGGVATGAPITLVLSGTGVGGNGALTSAAGSTVTWAGNINASGPATIAPGAGGTLTLTGAITGTGPVVFGANMNDSGYTNVILAPTVPGSSNYSGESQITGDNSRIAALTIELGANNGFSTAAGLNFVSSGGSGVTVDLKGYNQSVLYLAGGASSAVALTNSNSATTSILTITSGKNGSTPQSCGTQITGNIAVVMNDPTGTGNQILAGNSSYTGGTTITKGTLSVAASGALGSGTVSLNGGTLAFPAANLSGFSSYTLNGVATVSSNVLTVTNNGAHEAGSAFTSSKATLNLTTGFTATYTMNLNAANTGYVADGAGFVLENDPAGASALGAGGGAIGWTGIQNTFIAGFETYPYDFGQGGVNDVAFGTNGTFNQTGTSGCAITSQSVQVNLSYNGSAITETLTGLGTQGGTYTTTYNVNLASVLGSSSAYVGFTGGSGDGSALETISNFSMTNATVSAASIPNPVVANPGTSSIIQVSVSPGANTEPFTSLSLGAGSTVTLTTSNGSTGRVVLSTPSLSIASAAGSFTGKLDIGGNDLDLPGASIATISSMLRQGYANGNWNGNGITSNAAASDSTHLTALGVIVNDNGSGTPLYGVNGTLATTFDGATPADGDILVKYTYYGDANLDGAVDGSDYSIIDNSYLEEHTAGGTPVSGWYNGDFNYDGVVNGSDYTLIDNAFNSQGSSLGSNPLAQLATETAQVSGTSVPEPATLGLLAISSASLLGRRRRR